MRVRLWAFAGALLWATSALGQAAHADIVNRQGEKIGTATIQASGSGIKIDVSVTHLLQGTHAIHIHDVGKCDAPGFTTAGPHFNPAGKKHGKDNPDGPHAGDLNNFEVNGDGVGKASFVDPNASLGPGPNSIFHDGGTAIVIHADADDYKSDPAGNSGARIACGVITK